MKSLKNINSGKVEFHGQNDQQIILDPIKHIDYLDKYCGHEIKVELLQNTFKELQYLNDRLIEIEKNTVEFQEKRELLKFQANEIDSLNILEHEDVLLHEKYKKLVHLRDIIETLQDSNYAISEKNEAILPQIEYLKNKISFFTFLVKILGSRGFTKVREAIPLHLVLVWSKSDRGVSNYDHLNGEVNE